MQQLSKKDQKEQYKETELGLLPESWKIVTLGELNNKKKIGVIPGNFPDEIFEYYSIPAYQDGQSPILEIGKNILSQKILLTNGTVLFGKLNPRVEKVWLVRSETAVRKIGSTEWLPLFSDINIVNSNFLYYLQWSNYVMSIAKTLVTGSTPSRQRVDPTSFYKIKIPLPPLPEQQKIAFALSAIKQSQEKTNAVITSLQEFKKVMMKHLFTYGPMNLDEAKNMKLKETEMGKMPANWNVVKLGDIADFKNGINFNREQKGNIGILTIDVLNMYGDLYVNLNNLYRINKNVVGDYLLGKGDILFVRSSLKQEGVGWTSLFEEINEPVTYCGFIIRARLKRKDISPEFLTNFLRTEIARKKLVASSGKVAITNINQGMLGRILIPVPPFSIQQQIASILSSIDDKIKTEENKNKTIEELFKSMLHNLITAKVRVNNLVM